MESHHPITGWSAVFGFIGASVYGIVLAACAAGDPNWVFGINSLSDFGVSRVWSVRDMFNYGCMLTGVLFAVTGVLWSIRWKGMRRISALFIVLTSVALFFVGVFTKQDMTTHMAAAVPCFAFLALSILTMAYCEHLEGMFGRCMVTVTLILLTMCTLATQNIVVIEVVYIVAALCFMMVQCLYVGFDKDIVSR